MSFTRWKWPCLSKQSVSCVSPGILVLANYQLHRASSCGGSITTENWSGCPGLICSFYRAWGLSSPQLAPGRTGLAPSLHPLYFPSRFWISDLAVIARRFSLSAVPVCPWVLNMSPQTFVSSPTPSPLLSTLWNQFLWGVTHWICCYLDIPQAFKKGRDSGARRKTSG